MGAAELGERTTAPPRSRTLRSAYSYTRAVRRVAIPPAIKVSSMAFRIPARTHAPREILMEQPYGVRLVSDLQRAVRLFSFSTVGAARAVVDTVREGVGGGRHGE